MEKENKGIIYYTDNKVNNPIKDNVRYFINKSGLPVVSCSLKPIPFGDKNIVLEGRVRSYPTMLYQIEAALENLDTKYVFFCEHDVLYAKEHFDFTPPRDDVFYYNENVWRWKLHNFKLITYDKMRPLSCMVANREFALEHYKKRIEAMEKMGLDEFRSREPRMGRVWGYEPGTKKRRRGWFSDDECEMFTSEFPNIDIRHNRTFTSIKCEKEDFKNEPENWREIGVDEVPGWNLREIFKEGMENHSSHTDLFYEK
ncbi:MAG: hypothetical protein AAB875_02405 [Patescibacteria group bacterium]